VFHSTEEWNFLVFVFQSTGKVEIFKFLDLKVVESRIFAFKFLRSGNLVISGVDQLEFEIFGVYNTTSKNIFWILKDSENIHWVDSESVENFTWILKQSKNLSFGLYSSEDFHLFFLNSEKWKFYVF